MAAAIEEAATSGVWPIKPTNAKILVVGAGGIGCELLKNLVMTGFNHIEVIDLDTIDVSNLNRQFLFHREHVGKSKAEVAVSAMQSLLKRTGRGHLVDNIVYHHCSVFDPKFDVHYFGEFDLVLNALDNNAARSHVNRLCLAANKPLIESGTAGYLGQVSVIMKGVTECYDCQPKPVQRTYPGCTIRNTPSEPIHCIVWAKHLFNQLFGQPDVDEDVSPDTEDPELQANSEANGHASNGFIDDSSNSTSPAVKQKLSMRAWAESVNYNAELVFNKLFNDDICYLLRMDALWKTRQKPKPLTYQSIKSEETKLDENPTKGVRDQRVWSLVECRDTVSYVLDALKARSEKSKEALHWNKDDDVAVDFVTAIANIRAHVFHIPMKSRFDVKSMAGNIIPAIATTNAIMAACIVSEALKILMCGNVDTKSSKCVFFRQQPNTKGQIFVDEKLAKPNKACFVCGKKRTYVTLNAKQMTVCQFRDKVLKGALSMIAPDVSTADGRIIISSDEEECCALLDKTLDEMMIGNETVLIANDFAQALDLQIVVCHRDKTGELYELFAYPPPKVCAEDASTTYNKSANKRSLTNEDNDQSIIEAKKARIDA